MIISLTTLREDKWRKIGSQHTTFFVVWFRFLCAIFINRLCMPSTRQSHVAGHCLVWVGKIVPVGPTFWNRCLWPSKDTPVAWVRLYYPTYLLVPLLINQYDKAGKRYVCHSSYIIPYPYMLRNYIIAVVLVHPNVMNWGLNLGIQKSGPNGPMLECDHPIFSAYGGTPNHAKCDDFSFEIHIPHF